MKTGSRQRLSAYALVCVLYVAALPADSRARQTRTAPATTGTPTQGRERRITVPQTSQSQTPQTQTPRTQAPQTRQAVPIPTPTPAQSPAAAPTGTPAPAAAPVVGATPVVPAAAVAAPSTLEELRLRLREVLDQPQIASATAAVKIVSLDTGRTLFEENAGKLLNPASNMKLFTIAAALARLSPDYRITTSVYAPARPDDSGIIRGDLRIYGRGDPSFAKRFTGTDARAAIDELASRIQTAGVRRVEGDIVGDETFFAGAPLGRGWEWDDLQWYYGAEISALSVGDNAIDLIVRPGAQIGASCFVTSNISGAPLVTTINAPAPIVTSTITGGAASAEQQTSSATIVATAMQTSTVKRTSAQTLTTTSNAPESFLRIVNRATTAPSGTTRRLRVFRPLNSNTIEISGTMPLGDRDFTGSVSVTRPALLFTLLLRQSLAQRGITVTGETRVVSREDANSSSVPLASLVEIASRQSPTLGVIARETMKPSQNLYTELLLRQLAAPPGNAEPAAGITAEAGLEALDAFVSGAGIADDALVTADGSGLSRGDFVTADAVVRLLVFMDKHPAREAFRLSLPIAGVDGTLGNRLKGTRAAGNVLAKTGTLSNATSLSGYVTTRGGERLVFSFIINNYLPNANPRSVFADRLAALLADFGGRS